MRARPEGVEEEPAGAPHPGGSFRSTDHTGEAGPTGGDATSLVRVSMPSPVGRDVQPLHLGSHPGREVGSGHYNEAVRGGIRQNLRAGRERPHKVAAKRFSRLVPERDHRHVRPGTIAGAGRPSHEAADALDQHGRAGEAYFSAARQGRDANGAGR